MWSAQDIPDQAGRVAVITGANGGLGLASAKALAARGARVVMAARDQAKADVARDEILGVHPGSAVEVVELDLGSLASVASAARSILAAHDRIDVLMLNAGVMATPEQTTSDGFELQFGVNVLGHWALTAHLLPLVVRTSGARVVTLSSTAQHTGRAVDPADPHMRGDYDAWRMYGQTKLAARHFAQGLQQRFDAARVNARALCAQPGLTHSDLQSTTLAAGGGGFLAAFWHRWAATLGMSTDRGALSQLRAATDPRAPGGGFYGPLWMTNGPPVRKPLLRPGARAAIRTLWEVCERETGLAIDAAGALKAGPEQAR